MSSAEQTLERMARNAIGALALGAALLFAPVFAFGDDPTPNPEDPTPAEEPEDGPDDDGAPANPIRRRQFLALYAGGNQTGGSTPPPALIAKPSTGLGPGGAPILLPNPTGKSRKPGPKPSTGISANELSTTVGKSWLYHPTPITPPPPPPPTVPTIGS